MYYNKQDGSQVRNSNIELLRIISMLLIVAYHYACHGYNLVKFDDLFNQHVEGILLLGGKLGVSCFILISGYFMVRTKITLYKLVKLIAQVWFYSVGIAALFLLVLRPAEPLGIKDFVMAVVPIGTGAYWFMTDYIVLMLISPVINLAIEKMDKTHHRNMIILFVVIWSVIPSFTSVEYAYNDLGWFLVLYFIAGYIRKYVSVTGNNSSKHFIMAVVSYLFIIFSNILMIGLSHKLHTDFLLLRSGHFSALNSPFILLTSIELLIGFMKIKPNECLWVNKLASATLGVYLIHDNNMLRPYLWHTILKTESMYASDLFIAHALCCIIGVYIVCSLVDLIRQGTVERAFLAFLNCYLERIEKHLKIIWQ